MLRILIEFVIAIYLTSTILMLFFFANAEIRTYSREKKFFFIPIPLFLFTHFCPIVNTIKCIEIYSRLMKLL